MEIIFFYKIQTILKCRGFTVVYDFVYRLFCKLIAKNAMKHQKQKKEEARRRDEDGEGKEEEEQDSGCFCYGGVSDELLMTTLNDSSAFSGSSSTATTGCSTSAGRTPASRKNEVKIKQNIFKRVNYCAFKAFPYLNGISIPLKKIFLQATSSAAAEEEARALAAFERERQRRALGRGVLVLAADNNTRWPLASTTKRYCHQARNLTNLINYKILVN
jgi:hypothetical protein